MKHTLKPIAAALGLTLAASVPSLALADDEGKFMSDAKFKADLRLRYEAVEQDNALKDADALTLRTRLSFISGSVNGFSVVAEIENNSNSFGLDDYSVPPSGVNPGVYSVIADPKFTELDQGFIQYKNKSTTVKLGRQVIALDGQRHVGHVGWRQDRQTFDAFGINSKLFDNAVTVKYYYVNKRNRIFSDDADLDSKDHLLNISTNTALGKFTGYSYMLEVDNGTDNSLDTVGFSLIGKKLLDKAKLNYHLEYANQTSESGAGNFSADFWMFEAGLGFQKTTFKVGYESLGSDDGNYGFSTPLATLHKFNGWADMWLSTPAQGLEDAYMKVLGSAAGGKYLIAYHKFSAESPSNGVSDLGSEINLQYTRKINDIFSMGVKYAAYEAGDIKVDTDKLWLWLGAKF